jgi:hypothetical protein
MNFSSLLFSNGLKKYAKFIYFRIHTHYYENNRLPFPTNLEQRAFARNLAVSFRKLEALLHMAHIFAALSSYMTSL